MDTNDYRTERDQYFLKEEVYRGIHPNFFDPSDFPWVKEIEQNYHVILNEVEAFINFQKKMPKVLNPPYLSSADAWSNFYFMNFRWYRHYNCINNPKTFSLLKSIPNISFAAIAILEPHGEVLPHIGETNATIRCHMGLKIPGSCLDCGIKVNNECKGYEEGKVLMFSDAHLHNTWNKTDQKRVILIIDIVQPQFAYKSNWVCANALGTLTIKYIDEKIKIIKPFPEWALNIILKVLATAWYIYLPIQKKFSVFYRYS